MSSAPTTRPQDLLKAGLKAIGEVQGQALAQQTRIFELLLGLGAEPGGPPRPLEELFDARVARALQRLCPPDLAGELASLRRQLSALEAQLQALETPADRPRKPVRHA